MYMYGSCSVDFTELQSHYSVLVRSMPDDYMNTVNQLERHLTGDHIGSILECSNVFTANQRILDCLIKQLNDKEDVLDLCGWLGHIDDAPLLSGAIEDLKKGTATVQCVYCSMVFFFVFI